MTRGKTIRFMKENSPSTSPSPAAKIEKNKSLSKLNRAKVLWPAGLGLAVLLYFGLGYLLDTLTHESTDDAFIAGHIVSIAPRVAGQVTAVYVRDNQLVHSNDLMVQL